MAPSLGRFSAICVLLLAVGVASEEPIPELCDSEEDCALSMRQLKTKTFTEVSQDSQERCDWIPNDDCQQHNDYACFCRASNPDGPCTSCSPTSSCKHNCCGPQCPHGGGHGGGNNGPCRRLNQGAGSPWASCWESGHPYGSNEHCTIDEAAGHKIQVYKMDVENKYDYLKVNGHKYFTAGALQGVRANGPIEWSSDSIQVNHGWKICLFRN